MLFGLEVRPHDGVNQSHWLESYYFLNFFPTKQFGPWNLSQGKGLALCSQTVGLRCCISMSSPLLSRNKPGFSWAGMSSRQLAGLVNGEERGGIAVALGGAGSTAALGSPRGSPQDGQAEKSSLASAKGTIIAVRDLHTMAGDGCCLETQNLP